MGTPLDLAKFADDVARWALVRGGQGTSVSVLGPMPGNAGLSFGFDLTAADGSVEHLVMRLAPPGVRRRGNTDVLRQVPLLSALERSGIPVAPVLWSTDDPSWFGTDVIVQRRLDALPVHTFDREAGARPSDGDVTPHLRQAVQALADIHALDWQAELPTWDQPRSIATEVQFWLPILDKAPEAAWIEQGRELAAALLASDPQDHRVGLFHGDYQTHNILYRADGRLAAVIDWEIAGIGAVGLDLGWLAMMTDESCWYAPRRAEMLVRSDPQQLLAWYEQATGAPLRHFGWYEALAAYRYGVIAALNMHLHRSGRRVDEVSEFMGLGVPHLFARGLELCTTTSTREGGDRVDHV